MKKNKLNLETPHNFGRHGEILLRSVDAIPKGAKLIEENKSIVVGHSESGHHHVLTAEKGVAIKMYEIDGKTYLDLPSKGTLTHQKASESHQTQVFSPGIYIREIRQSYSYGQKIMRNTID